MGSCNGYFGMPLQSLPLAYNSGKANQQTKLDFISNAVDNMDMAEVDEMWLHIADPGATVAAGETARGDLFWQIVDAITFKDVLGERIVCDMTSLRRACQMALGQRFFDPPDVTNGGGAPLVVPLDLWMPYPIFRPDALSNTPRRFRSPAADIAKGSHYLNWGGVGSVIGTGAGNRFTVSNQAFAELWVTACDKGPPNKNDKTPMRAVIRDTAINASEDQYVMPKERIMLLDWFFGAGNENDPAGLNPWPSQIFSSRTWLWNDIIDTYYKNQYLYRRRGVRTPDPANAAAAEDETLRGLGVPLYVCREDQPPGELPNVDQDLHLKTSIPFNAGGFDVAHLPKLIRMSLVDDPGIVGETCQGKGAYSGHAVGAVASPEGGSIAIDTVPTSLRAKVSRFVSKARSPKAGG